jgi:hypothetical protein
MIYQSKSQQVFRIETEKDDSKMYRKNAKNYNGQTNLKNNKVEKVQHLTSSVNIKAAGI